MDKEVSDGLCMRQGLTQGEIAEIKQLEQVCNTYEGLGLKLNWNVLTARAQNETNDFLYYEQGELVGFLPIFSFNTKEAEISGMVHPQQRRKGIFRKLFEAARTECQRRGIPRLLLVVEQQSKSGHAFVASVKPLYDHTTHKMVLGEVHVVAYNDQHLHFRPATPGDIPALKYINIRAFGENEDDTGDWYAAEAISSGLRRFYVAELDGVVIGKLDVAFAETTATIYSFGMLPEYRRHGYGRQLLTYAIQTLLMLGYQHVELEVAVDNEHALNLYQTCGFTISSAYDYYHLNI